MKKNYARHFSRRRRVLIKYIIMMKVVWIIMLVSVLGVSAGTSKSYSQTTKLNLQLKDATLEQVIWAIKEKTEFDFFYNSDDIQDVKGLDIDSKNSTADEILELCLRNTSLTYEIVNKTVIIKKSELKKEPSKTKEPGEQQPQAKTVKGRIIDAGGSPIPGTTIMVKGQTIGTIADVDGNFELEIPLDSKTLVFSFVGMQTQEIDIGNTSTFNITMAEATVGVEEVVVVGYGQQKKESVVGAITNTTSKELERTGGVTNLGQALTGNLPGLTTIQISGQPGEDDPQIFIRGNSTWNGGQPYILVDGIERNMNELDFSEVETISVLKDASATAVFGVKGANGVILITTKRGKKGKAKLSISANSTMKIPSRLPNKLDSYDTYMIRNEAIEREVVISETSWEYYMPIAMVERYRNQDQLKYPEAYPNVDWADEMFNDVAWNHRVNLNVAGGTDFVKYFSSIAYLHEGDLIKTFENGKGYDPGFGYNRFNFRSNLDFNITNSTLLKVNLSGYYGIRKDTYGYDNDSGNGRLWAAAYTLSPSAFLPQYSDGRWGNSSNNSIGTVSNTGIREQRRTELDTDISLTQKLDFITKGLSVSASVAFDNYVTTVGGIWDIYNRLPEANSATKWIDPEIEDIGPDENPEDYIFNYPTTGINQFDWVVLPWEVREEDTQTGSLRRRLFYQAQINYARTFGKHDVTATGVFNREETASGSMFPQYREDWVFRTTYNYDSKYFLEVNGAYNGSEQFGPGYRFDFFPSVAVGWMISNEKFLTNTEWLDKLKIRYSYGIIGDDRISSGRWLYESQWSYGGQSYLGDMASTWSPYTWYKESVIGNPDIQWETAKKMNFGFEMAVLNNMLSTNIEYFKENRTDIFLSGDQRTLPVFFGGTPPAANVGETEVKGYEAELRFNKNLNREFHIWAVASATHSKDVIKYKEDPPLLDAHRKAEGFAINQTKTQIYEGYITSWDEIYNTTIYDSNDAEKLPGYFSILDFNGDGVINGYDSAPYGYSTRPQNAYNFSFGADYKGFSVMLQFYGVNNVTRGVYFNNFLEQNDIAYEHTLDFWSKDNPDASSFLPRYQNIGALKKGQYYLYDGSYLRLKTAEIAYTFKGEKLSKYGISSLKLFLNGNNLIFWSDLPDDREIGSGGAYPTSKRINMGFDINF